MDAKFLKECARVFTFAFLGTFLPAWAASGFWVAPDWAVAKAATIAALFGAVSVAVKALADFLTKGVSPAPSVGIFSPNVKA